MRFSGLGVVAALLGLLFACTSPAAWRADLIAGRPVAGVVAGDDARDGSFVTKGILNDLEASGAIQDLEHERYWERASGFAEGDLQDVEWFYTDFEIRGIVAVPRIPGGIEGWREQARALGLEVVGFFGVSERRNGEYAHLYSTVVPDVYLEIADDGVRAIVRPISPFERPGAEVTWLVQWFTEIDDEPRYMVHPWNGIQAECRDTSQIRRDTVRREMRLDDVVTPEVAEFFAQLP